MALLRNNNLAENEIDKTTLIKNYEGIVVCLARSFRPRNREEKRDLIQAGYLGLLAASKLYDPTKYGHVKFSSYAWIAIKNEMIKQWRQNTENESLSILLEDRRKRINIFHYLTSLTEVQENIVRMKLAGFDFRTIATTLNKTLGSVYHEYKMVIQNARIAGKN